MGDLPAAARRWSDAACPRRPAPGPTVRCRIGVLPGEGVGPEVVDAALRVLTALERDGGPSCEIRFGPAIGAAREAETGEALPDDVVSFCSEIFGSHGAVLAGPGGGRFVYELRRRFDLYCKVVPLRTSPVLSAGAIFPRGTPFDILLIRENTSGTYMGTSNEHREPTEGRIVEHTFRYTEREVRRIVEAAARLSSWRRGEMTVIVKDGGMPALTGLWRDVASDVAGRCGVRAAFLNVDLAAYELARSPDRFDVVVAPNLFGDILGDLGTAMVGSRALGYSGNFAEDGAAVYQTSHGAGHDIAGEGRANPVGQILSAAMMLTESFGLAGAAERIERAVEETWSRGFCTFDLPHPGGKVVGTEEMAEQIATALKQPARAEAG
jgi:3-isopropylmalate dehydrogenase